ncbi:hypothetical protein EVAR_69074_1 [Eumeta japonica]|uniref:Uncharacterized protein n=1 Tax=Eumeta variegata TaxID=151549 RepID=A0A4C1ZHG9_EUMVA|nr:hypothetical protein EVAR_69074_1 [Eumeta japonica]
MTPSGDVQHITRRRHSRAVRPRSVKLEVVRPVARLAVKNCEADAAGYVSLVEDEYKAISDVDKYYTKSVPASAHAYYHHVMWWHRIALCAAKRGTASLNQQQLIDFIQGYTSCEVAAGAGTYLSGLGDFEDGTGVKHYPRASEPNVDWHFGEISPQTHRDYEYRIAPTVSLHRVLQDVAATVARRENDAWLPPGLVPEPEEQFELANEVSDEQRQLRNRRRNDEERGVEKVGEDLAAAEEEEDVEEEEAYVPNLPTVNLLGWRAAAQLKTRISTQRCVQHSKFSIPMTSSWLIGDTHYIAASLSSCYAAYVNASATSTSYCQLPP